MYMGINSTAKIPTRGKVDEDWEILLNTYATAYDAINNIMLTRTPGVFDRTTVREVRGRFLVLKRIARRYAPERLQIIERLEELAVARVKGEITTEQYLRSIRALATRYGLRRDMVDLVEARIRAAEMVNPGIVNAGVKLKAVKRATTKKTKKSASKKKGKR